ncbi:hypothetical protein [Microbacterium aurugineum]
MKTPLSAVAVSCTRASDGACWTPTSSSAISTAARNAAHLARALKAQEYPAG